MNVAGTDSIHRSSLTQSILYHYVIAVTCHRNRPEQASRGFKPSSIIHAVAEHRADLTITNRASLPCFAGDLTATLVKPVYQFLQRLVIVLLCFFHYVLADFAEFRITKSATGTFQAVRTAE